MSKTISYDDLLACERNTVAALEAMSVLIDAAESLLGDRYLLGLKDELADPRTVLHADVKDLTAAIAHARQVREDIS